jgi:hypothetical protein
LGELVLAQDVKCPPADLARDAQARPRAVGARGDLPVVGVIGVGRPAGVHGGLDQRPAQVR